MSDTSFDSAEVLTASRNKHKSGDLDAAREGYLEVLRREPDNAAALNLLGTLDAQLGSLEDAERLIRRAISNAPGEGAYFTNLAGVLQEQKRFTEAIQAYRVALKMDPDQPEVLNNFGVLLLDAGKAREAEQCFRKVLDTRPDAPEVHNNLGRALNNQRQHEKALQAFQEAVRLAPEYAAAYNNLGHVCRTLGRNTMAAAGFQEAIRLDPGLTAAYQNLGTVYMAQNMPEQAIECFEEALRREPGNAGAFADLGVALHALGRLDGAVDAYRKAVARDPNNPHTYLNLGVVLYERRNLKAAETALRQALVLKPDLIDAAAELAAILDEQGRLDETQQVVEQGLGLDPDHIRLNLEAARLERRKGKISAAIERLSKFDLKALDAGVAQQLRYELGRLHDRAGEPGLAWLHANEANKLVAAGWRAQQLDPERQPRILRALRAFYETANLAEQPPYEDDGAAAPAFLVGFPACGSHFLAEALGVHQRLQTLDEAPTLSAVEQALSAMPDGYPAAIISLGADRVRREREVYWQTVSRWLDRNSDALLVDHQPMRAVHAGLVWRLFPAARFVYVQRHPADLCVANVMQSFALNDTNAHFLNLESTIDMLDLAYRTWRAAAAALPLDVLVVRYESLAQDPQAEVNRVISFLGQEPSTAVEAFVDEAVAGQRITNCSFRQLADPLDAHTLGRWRDYRRELSRVADKLMPLAREMGYEFD